MADLRALHRPAGLTEPLANPADESGAEQLHALVNGLAVQAITYPDRMPPARLRAVLLEHLEALPDPRRSAAAEGAVKRPAR